MTRLGINAVSDMVDSAFEKRGIELPHGEQRRLQLYEYVFGVIDTLAAVDEMMANDCEGATFTDDDIWFLIEGFDDQEEGKLHDESI